MLHPHRRAHARIWTALAVLLPVIVVVALVIRQNGPREAPPVQLSEPLGTASGPR
jgi:hypothetical protein